MCRICLCLIIAIKLINEVSLIHCTKPGQVAESAAPVLAEETAKTYSVPDEENYKDFLRCYDELEEDETAIDDDRSNIVTSLYFTYFILCLLYSVPGGSILLSFFILLINKL